MDVISVGENGVARSQPVQVLTPYTQPCWGHAHKNRERENQHDTTNMDL